MRKIIVGAQVSMDGVMQAPGGPTEDPTKGFKFGGWAMPYFDQESFEELDRVFKEKFDLLLGRKTYEIFAAYWPYYEEDAPHGGIAKLFNDIKKYAVSRSGEVDTSWAGSVLLRDIVDVKAPEAGRRPEPRHPGQYRTRPRAARQRPGRRYEHLHGAGRAWRRQEAVRRRLGARSSQIVVPKADEFRRVSGGMTIFIQETVPRFRRRRCGCRLPLSLPRHTWRGSARRNAKGIDGTPAPRNLLP